MRLLTDRKGVVGMPRAECTARLDRITPPSGDTAIALGRVLPLGPELKAVATDVLQGLQYSFVAAAAHPAVRLPFGSLEESFQAVIALRPADQRWGYHARARQLAMASAETRQAVFGRYGKISAEEFARVGLAIACRYLRVQWHTSPGARTAASSAPPAVAPTSPPTTRSPRTTLTLHITDVSCLDRAAEEPRGEEIAVGGLALDASGGIASVGRFLVRDDFENGVRKEYGFPGRKLCEFHIPETLGSHPLTYGAATFLEVADRAGLTECLAGAFAKASPILRHAVETRVAGVEAASISQAAGYVIARFVRWLGKEFQDDLLPPGLAFAGLHAGLDPANGASRSEFNGAPGQFTFAGPRGRYRVGGQWRVSRAA
jgi:hypothetical protein